MESCDRSRVRKYRKSSVPRLRWTSELHHHFVHAVQMLGGKHQATPKRIKQMMGVRGLEISHIKSHLQMHRSMKKSTENKSDYITLFPLKQVSQGLRETPSHRIQMRRKINQTGENLLYQVKGRKGSTGNIGMDRWAELAAGSEPEPDPDRQTYRPSKHCIGPALNLDLTMSSQGSGQCATAAESIWDVESMIRRSEFNRGGVHI